MSWQNSHVMMKLLKLGWDIALLTNQKVSAGADFPIEPTCIVITLLNYKWILMPQSYLRRLNILPQHTLKLWAEFHLSSEKK